MLKHLTPILIIFSFSAFSEEYNSDNFLKTHPLRDYFTIESRLILKMFDSRGICDSLPSRASLPTFCEKTYKKLVEKAKRYGLDVKVSDFRSLVYKNALSGLERAEAKYIDNYSKSVSYDHKKTTPFKKNLRKIQRDTKKEFIQEREGV